MKATLQQNKRHGDRPVGILLPDDWETVHETMVCDKKSVVDYDAIHSKIESPIGSQPLSELAKGKKRVCAPFNDMSRPTPCQTLAGLVSDILLEDSVKKENIIFIAVVGSHGSLIREDFTKKLSEKIATEHFVYNRFPYNNLVKVGTAKRGFDVMVNKEVMECDSCIGLGTMILHAADGFSGGYRVLSPGVAGIETTSEIHSHAGKEMVEEMKHGHCSSPMGKLLDQDMRFEIEEYGKMAGNLLKIDCFLNTRSEIIDTFAGDPIDKYYETAKMCKNCYKIEKPGKMDVITVNPNLKSSGSNVSYGVTVQYFMDEKNKNGDIVFINFTKSGQVPHYIIRHSGRTTKARLSVTTPDLREDGLSIYFSSYGGKSGTDEISMNFDRYVWIKAWDEVMELSPKHGAGTKALVINEGAIVSFKEWGTYLMEILLEQSIQGGRELIKINFSDERDVSRIDIPADSKSVLTKEETWKKLERPYGMSPLSQMATRREKIGVTLDNGSRGTPCGTVAEMVLEILLKAGAKKESIFFIYAPGSYGAFGRRLFLNKLGEKIINEYLILNHDYHESCTNTGVLNGVDIKVNNEFLSCDLRIDIGGILPHTMSGFSGGNRLLISGLCYLDTMEDIHSIVNDCCETVGDNLALLIGYKENMMMHEMISEMVEMIGGFFRINRVCSSKMKLVGLFGGHTLAEYMKAAILGGKMMMMLTLEKPADIVIASSSVKISYAASDLTTGLPYLEKGGMLMLVNHTKSGQIPHCLRGNWGKNCQSRIPVGNGLDLPCKVIYSSKHGDYNARKATHLEHSDYVWVKTQKDVMNFITAEYKGPRIYVLTETSMGII